MSRLFSPRMLRNLLPAFTLTVLLLAIFYLQPRAMSYTGLNLLLNLALPIALATPGPDVHPGGQRPRSGHRFLRRACRVHRRHPGCNDTPLLGVAALLGCIAIYGLLGALIHTRNLPSIVVTLGMSFVWLGLGDPRAADAGRQGARLDQPAVEAEDTVPAGFDLHLDPVRGGRALRADALGIRRRAARHGRKTRAPSSGRAGRCFAPRSPCIAWPGSSGTLSGDHADRHHDVVGRQYRLALHALFHRRGDSRRR